VINEVIKEIEVIKEVEKPVEVIKEIIKEIEVIKEVPVEIIKEVEVVKEIDFESLAAMMSNMDTVEVSRSITGETTSRSEAKEVSSKNLNVTKSKAKKSEVKKTSTKSAKKTSTKSSSKSGVSAKARSKKLTVKTKGKSQKDDLTKIEGIGPKIAGLLNADGILTFKALSQTKVKVIQGILDKAGPRYRIHSPKTWPKQSKLAAAGKWDDLKKWQDELDGGR